MTAERDATPRVMPAPPRPQGLNPVEQALANMVRDVLLERRLRRANLTVVDGRKR